MATYKDQLHKIVEDSSFPASRAEDIKHDLKTVFEDGSVFGELVGEVASAVIGKMIQKTGLDDVVTMTTEGIKDVVKEAVSTVLESNVLLQQMSEDFAQKQADRTMGVEQERGKEMGE